MARAMKAMDMKNFQERCQKQQTPNIKNETSLRSRMLAIKFDIDAGHTVSGNRMKEYEEWVENGKNKKEVEEDTNENLERL